MWTKWWVFRHSSIPHTKLLLVPSNLLRKFNGFFFSLPKAITSGVAKCFSSSKNFGTLITKWFWANHKLSTDLICLYQKPFASGLANSWCINHLGELITNYGFPLPLPQAITLRASQLFTFKDMVSWIPYNFGQIANHKRIWDIFTKSRLLSD